ATVARSRRADRDGRVRATARRLSFPPFDRNTRQPCGSGSPGRPQAYYAIRVPGWSRPGDETDARSYEVLLRCPFGLRCQTRSHTIARSFPDHRAEDCGGPRTSDTYRPYPSRASHIRTVEGV